MTWAGQRLAKVVEELATEMESAGEGKRASALRTEVQFLRGDTVRRLDIERMNQLCGAMAWLTGSDLPSLSKAERLRKRLKDALESGRQ